jgi:hypothetical protein
MGWYGTFCNNDLRSIKRALEDGLTRTHENGTKQTLLYHSFKFGRSHMAIEHIEPNGERKVFALVCLWRYSEDQVMIKTMDETCGPGYFDAPMKLLKMLTPPINTYAHNWRVTCWKKYKKIPLEYQKYIED